MTTQIIKNTFQISGMSCTNCAKKIERKVSELPHVIFAQVNLLSEKMYVEYEENLSETEIEQAVQEVGYQIVHTLYEKEKADNQMRNRVLWSILFTLPLLYLAMGHMFNFPLPHLFHDDKVMVSVQLLLSIPIILLNKDYYRHGFKNLIERDPNMDSLVALGTSAAFLQGIVATFLIFNHYKVDIYFESGAIILTLITIGKYFEHLSKQKTTIMIKSLLNLSSNTAVKVINGDYKEVPIDIVNVGDVLVSKIGDKIVLDGEIVEGKSQIDESMLTGESLPITKTVGDNVIGGTINLSNVIYYRVNKVGKDTTLNQMVALMEEASQSKMSLVQLTDRIAKVFVPIIIFLAILSSLVWLIVSKDIVFSSNILIAVLIIACPCALGLAIPTAVMVFTGRAAKQGIMIKQGSALEQLKEVDTIILDKTGTITQGKPTVESIFIPSQKEEIIALIASLENKSNHPLAKAVVTYAKNEKINLKTVEMFEVVDGIGVRGVVDKKQVAIGNKKIWPNETEYDKQYDQFVSQGKIPLFIVVDNQLVGMIIIFDLIKEKSVNAIRELQKRNIDVIMVTGDNEKTATYIANQVGISQVIAQVLPQDKANIVKDLQNQGKKVVMVGDGINDSIALSQAMVGIAIGNGIDVAMESADIVLMKQELNDIITAIDISYQTVRLIKQNLFWAFIYNIIGVPLAMGVFFAPFGWLLNPIFSGLAMSFSSISVVLNALRYTVRK